MGAITLLAVAAIILPILLGIFGLVGDLEPSCDPVLADAVACGERSPQLDHIIEPDEQTAEQATSVTTMTQRPIEGPFVPRIVMAGMPQEYQQQLQPLRSFQAAINASVATLHAIL
jgi:cell division septation protein DedD